MVLVSFVLVLAAAATLVAGLLQQAGLTLIYVSIGCSVLAGLVLAAAVLRGRPESAPAAAGPRRFEPSPTPEPAPSYASAPSTPSWERTEDREPATVGGGRPWERDEPGSIPPLGARVAPPDGGDGGGADPNRAAGTALLGRLRRRTGGAAEPPPEPLADDGSTAEAEPEPEVQPDLADGPVPAAAEALGADDGGAVEADDGFPIPDYERKRATEIIVRLADLDRRQLTEVREREASTKNRFSVLSRIDARLAAEEEPDSADLAWKPDADVPAGGVGADLPIPGYDRMRVGQILPALGSLDAEQLEAVRRHEAAGRARSTILERIRRLTADAPAPAAIPLAAPAPEAPIPEAPLPVAPARRTTRKAPAARSTATRKATEVAKTAAGKATSVGRTAAATASTVKSAAAEKASAVKKAPAAARKAVAAKKSPAATKAPAATRAPAVKRAPAARKAPAVKKVPAVKKAPSTGRAAPVPRGVKKA